jgi:hypothetical protein
MITANRSFSGVTPASAAILRRDRPIGLSGNFGTQEWAGTGFGAPVASRTGFGGYTGFGDSFILDSSRDKYIRSAYQSFWNEEIPADFFSQIHATKWRSTESLDGVIQAPQYAPENSLSRQRAAAAAAAEAQRQAAADTSAATKLAPVLQQTQAAATSATAAADAAKKRNILIAIGVGGALAVAGAVFLSKRKAKR